MSRVVRKHLRDFAAILGLVAVAVVVVGFILAHQRFSLPGWVPLVGRSAFTLKGEFSTAQAVTPGQGQTVDIAGVPVGEISDVKLQGGRAVVTMEIRKRYSDIRPDATLLLRPRTGLKDMTVQLDPGSAAAGPRVRSGFTVPAANTAPDVNLDEVLSSLDADSRDYLQLLIHGGAAGLRGQGPAAAQALRRLDPTARYLRRVTGLLARRRANLRRAMHNLSLVAQALGSKDRQLGSLVESSSTFFGALAHQDARLRDAVARLPGALGATHSALTRTDALARELGPTLQALRPGARALGPALARTRPLLRDTTPAIRDQIRPFARAALPTVRRLEPAARDLARATPDLVTAARVVNQLLNELAYNPPGKEEGYLFWLSWVNHTGNSVFSTQDAHGPIRRGLAVISCETLVNLRQIAQVDPSLNVLLNLLGLNLCPRPTGSSGGAP